MKNQILLCTMTILLLSCMYQIGINKKELKNNVSQIEYFSGQMVDKKERNETSLQEYPDWNSWIKIDSTKMDYYVMQKKIIPTIFKIMTYGNETIINQDNCCFIYTVKSYTFKS